VGGIGDLGPEADETDVDMPKRPSRREAMARNSWVYGIRCHQLRVPVGIGGVQGEDGDTRTDARTVGARPSKQIVLVTRWRRCNWRGVSCDNGSRQ
jgi:hypothetical protein